MGIGVILASIGLGLGFVSYFYIFLLHFENWFKNRKFPQIINSKVITYYYPQNL